MLCTWGQYVCCVGGVNTCGMSREEEKCANKHVIQLLENVEHCGGEPEQASPMYYGYT